MTTADQMMFEFASGMERREHGIRKVYHANKEFVKHMQAQLFRIIKERGSASSDDLRRYAHANNILPENPNAWGAVFHHKDLVKVGYRSASTPSCNGREIKVWTIRKEAA